VSKSCPENSARIEFQYIFKPRVEGMSDAGTQCYSSLKFQLQTQPKKRERERERERESVLEIRALVEIEDWMD
jgi:hypothetical protein